jgi:hypothetical protein
MAALMWTRPDLSSPDPRPHDRQHERQAGGSVRLPAVLLHLRVARIVRDREIHRAGNEAEVVDLVMQAVGAFARSALRAMVILGRGTARMNRPPPRVPISPTPTGAPSEARTTIPASLEDAGTRAYGRPPGSRAAGSPGLVCRDRRRAGDRSSTRSAACQF